MQRLVDLAHQTSVQKLKKCLSKRSAANDAVNRDFDRNFEKQKILNSLRNTKFSQNIKVQLHKTEVQVIDEENAEIVCPICIATIKIKAYEKTNSSAWSIANSSRHVRSQHEEGESEEDTE